MATRHFPESRSFTQVSATPEDPLEKTQALRKVHFVMKDGRIVRGPK